MLVSVSLPAVVAADAIAHLGKSYLFDYGDVVIRVRYLSASRALGVVTQVVDFGKGVVHTTWTSPGRKLTGFQGKVKAGE
jgi:hypothetical protein